MKGKNPAEIVSHSEFIALRGVYEKKWRVRLCLLDTGGEPVLGRFAAQHDNAETRRLAADNIAEAVRWGDAPFALLPDGGMMWLVPVMINMLPLGCVAAFLAGEELAAEENRNVFAAMREAARELRNWAEENNLTNAALLEQNRQRYLYERRRAETIHDLKIYSPDFRLLYIREEPALMSAIRRGDRDAAKEILNHILVVLFCQAGENFNLVKSFVLEIITMMSRTAVEAGCDAAIVFGSNYEEFAALSVLQLDHEFSLWLHEIMDRLIDAIHRGKNRSVMPQIQAALDFMRDNLADDISLEHVAGVAHMSPSHFSRLFKKVFNEGFSNVLNRLRTERASELLSTTDNSLISVAFDCGFNDQSYFTRIFRKHYQKTPKEYRNQHRKT